MSGIQEAPMSEDVQNVSPSIGTKKKKRQKRCASRDSLVRINHFFKQTVITESGCMEWQGTVMQKGYPTAGLFGKTIRVHRYIYKSLVGEIPENMFVCHTCDNRKCINPDHLFVGSVTDNNRDMMKKRRSRYGKNLAQNTHRAIARLICMGSYDDETAKVYNISVPFVSYIAVKYKIDRGGLPKRKKRVGFGR